MVRTSLVFSRNFRLGNFPRTIGNSEFYIAKSRDSPSHMNLTPPSPAGAPLLSDDATVPSSTSHPQRHYITTEQVIGAMSRRGQVISCLSGFSFLRSYGGEGSDNNGLDGSGSEDTIGDDTTDQDTVDAAKTVNDNQHESFWTNKNNVSIDSSISRVVRYHFDEHSSKDKDIEDEVRAEHKLLHDAGLLPEVRNPRKIRPRSVNMAQLQTANKRLRRKKEKLMRELCKLGYENSDVEACILWKTAEILPEKPGNIDAYCLSNYNLRWLNEKLELFVDNRQAVVDAMESFLVEASSLADLPNVKSRRQRPPHSMPESINPLELLDRGDKFLPGSRRTNPYPSTSITAGPTDQDESHYFLESILHKDDDMHNSILPFQADSPTLQHYPPALRGTFGDVGRESHSAAE
ncbi:hypothetical protein G6514_008990 [Epicoccum nigrum]|nr:hypothetical protein G6514_008990 [Epicoccum nigrum]